MHRRECDEADTPNLTLGQRNCSIPQGTSTLQQNDQLQLNNAMSKGYIYRKVKASSYIDGIVNNILRPPWSASLTPMGRSRDPTARYKGRRYEIQGAPRFLFE